MRRGIGGPPRLWRAVQLLPLAGLAALACAVAASGSRTDVAEAPTLVVDNSFALDTVDPQRGFDPTSQIVERAVYDTLFTYRRNDAAHPVPLLVRSWRSRGSKTFTFRLRKD